MAGNDAIRQLAGICLERVDARNGAVEDGNSVALLRNIQRKVRPHRAKADQADFGLRHIYIPSLGFRRGRGVEFEVAAYFDPPGRGVNFCEPLTG